MSIKPLAVLNSSQWSRLTEYHQHLFLVISILKPQPNAWVVSLVGVDLAMMVEIGELAAVEEMTARQNVMIDRKILGEEVEPLQLEMTNHEMPVSNNFLANSMLANAMPGCNEVGNQCTKLYLHICALLYIHLSHCRPRWMEYCQV